MNGRHQADRTAGASPRGFTLIELLVVMAIVATLLSIAVPRYFASVDRSKEVVLKQSLAVMRDAIDKYHADHGRYPGRLEELVEGRYIRGIPVDPITETTTSWVAVAVPPDAAAKGDLYDVKSGAPGQGIDGTNYADW